MFTIEMPKSQRKADAIEQKIRDEEREKKKKRSEERLAIKNRRKSQAKIKCSMLMSYARSKQMLNDEKEDDVIVTQELLQVEVLKSKGPLNCSPNNFPIPVQAGSLQQAASPEAGRWQ